MNIAAQCAWAAGRALVVAALCVVAGRPVAALLSRLGRRVRRLQWAALLAPALAPALLVGYAYSNFSLSLVHHPGWNHLLYGVLLWMRLLPVAVVVMYFAPSFMSVEAAHCRRLLNGSRRGLRGLALEAAFLARGSLRAPAAAFGVAFLLAFGEFEIASLLGVRTWTVSVFDAHSGGLALPVTLRLIAMPVLVEATVLLAVLLLLFLGSGRAGPPMRASARPLPAVAALVCGYMAAAVVLVVVIPACVVLRGTARGAAALVRNFVLGREIAASAGLALAAGVLAYLAAGCFGAWGRRRRAAAARLACACCASAPGLLGPLVLSLLIVLAFQASCLRLFYDTPLPLGMALVLLLLPLALVLRNALGLERADEGLHAAQLLSVSACQRVRQQGRRLLWHLRTRPRFWVLFLLSCWGYFEFTASAILAPPAMTPVTVRLYNLMHYGQSHVLSAMVCAAALVPVAVLIVVEGVRGMAPRLKRA